MNLSRFFIDRPVLSTVLSIIITLLGGLAYFNLPVSQYPEVVPPTVVVRATYPGADAETLTNTVSIPIEQELNGVENMLYMSSSSTSDGVTQITVTFKLGTDLDQAQVQVQNRVSAALPRLPEEVRRLGVTALKRSPDLSLAIQFYSPDGSRDSIYLSNYVTLQIQNELARLPGVSEASSLGGLDYTMRIWLDPEKIAARNLTAGDVVDAIREQNIQVVAGQLGQPPVPSGTDFQYTLRAQGRLVSTEQFADIVIRTGENGDVIRVGDVARLEIGGKDYAVKSYRDRDNAVSLRIFQMPGTNALETANAVYKKMQELEKDFPPGVAYSINYNPTKFIEESMHSVFVTLLEAVVLVVLVIVLFLQRWRASIIPLLAVPVSLIGTLAVMYVCGFSLNNLSLFGLVLAIGIVVDDAIVVVENVERYIEEGLAPKEATVKAMSEVVGPIIAISLVLCAVFVPTAFVSGITGSFYRQFALTIAASTAISAINSLTLSPALCAILLQPHGAKRDVLTWLIDVLFGWFFKGFNKVFKLSSELYAGFIRKIAKVAVIFLLIYGGLLWLTANVFQKVPVGFIPSQDMGYFIVSVQLPDSASVERSDTVIQRVLDMALNEPGVAHSFAITGFSNVLGANQSNLGSAFIITKPHHERGDLTTDKIIASLRTKFASIQEARVVVLPPPPLRGLGSAGGFKIQVQDRNNAGLDALEKATETLMDALNKEPGFNTIITGYRPYMPQYFVDIDRQKAKTMDISLSDINETLQVYLGSIYVNDFNLFGRTYQVTAMAEPSFRIDPSDVGKLQVKNGKNEMVPLGALVTVYPITGPSRLQRYNMYMSSDISGNVSPDMSSGDMIAAVERLAKEHLPDGFSFEWTDLTYQQILAGNTIIYIFPLCVFFVFLVLAALYESWSLPLAVILIVPMCLLSAMAGVWWHRMDNNLFTQIGLVVLIALAAKNAILIVEFAKQKEEEGMNRFEAAVESCRLRLRPIIMTSMAFILGVLPLVLAKGPGAEMRKALGTTVFYGMIGVTIFGLIFTPIFYVIIRKFGKKGEIPVTEHGTQQG